MESLTNQEEVELRSKIEALGLEVTKVPSKSTQHLDEVDIVYSYTIFNVNAFRQRNSLLVLAHSRH